MARRQNRQSTGRDQLASNTFELMAPHNVYWLFRETWILRVLMRGTSCTVGIRFGGGRLWVWVADAV